MNALGQLFSSIFQPQIENIQAQAQEAGAQAQQGFYILAGELFIIILILLAILWKVK